MIESDLLLHAYRLGVFPMAMEDGEIRWFSPDPRTILPLDTFHIPHGLKRERRAQAIEIRIDTRFVDVIQACAARDDTWINDEIIASYSQLHELGHAHSVEAWSADELVGGLYGNTAWQWLFVDLLWVDTPFRRQGLGRRLLRAAEAAARARGCTRAFLDTFDFQARPFYEREGYVVFGTQEEYPPGHRKFYLGKSLE
jgi:GNAT superfamily N-acetyltransferase